MQDLPFVLSKAKFCLIQFHVHSISMHPSSIALKFNCALFFQSHHQASLCFLVDQAKLDFVSPSWSFGPPCVWSNRSPSDLRRTFWINPVSWTTNQKHIRVFRNFFNRLQPKKQLCPKTVAHISENCLIYVFVQFLRAEERCWIRRFREPWRIHRWIVVGLLSLWRAKIPRDPPKYIARSICFTIFFPCLMSFDCLRVVNLCMHNKTGEVLFQVKQAESDADRCVSYASPVSIPPQEGPDGYVNHKLLVPSASRRPDDARLMLKGFGQHDLLHWSTNHLVLEVARSFSRCSAFHVLECSDHCMFLKHT